MLKRTGKYFELNEATYIFPPHLSPLMASPESYADASPRGERKIFFKTPHIFRFVMILLTVVVARGGADAAPQNVTVQAGIKQTSGGIDETLVYTLSISTDFEGQQPKIQFPDFNGFRDLGHSQSEQVSMSFGTGGKGFKKTLIISVSLKPLKTGSLEIGPAVVVVNGAQFRSERVSVSISPAGKSQPRQQQVRPQRPPSLWDDDFGFDSMMGRSRQASKGEIKLLASVDKNTVYVGEQFLYSLELLSTVPIRGLEALSMPEFEGFWSEDVAQSQKITAEPKSVGGIEYNAYLLKRKMLFPEKQGSMIIKPASVQVSPGASFFSSGRSVSRASEQLSIQVKPLPDEGRPASFHPENIGIFTYGATLSAPRTDIDKPVTLKLSVSGTGNIKAVKIPAFENPDFKIFDPTVTDRTFIASSRIIGEKVWEYLILPKKGGGIRIRPPDFTFFNPDNETYQTVQPPELDLHVTGEPGEVHGAGNEGRTAFKNGDEGLAPIHYSGSLEKYGRPIYSEPWFKIMFLFFPLVYMVLVVYTRITILFRRNASVSRQRKAHSSAVKKLAAAQKLKKSGVNPAVFYSELCRVIFQYLSDRLAIEATGITHEALEQSMIKAGIDSSTAAQTIREIEHCDYGRFAPVDTAASEMKAALERTRDLLIDLEKSV